jgi:hypothetical protein
MTTKIFDPGEATFALSGGDFQGMGSFDPMKVGRRKNESSRPPFIVSMSPPGYPSAWLRPRSARFRFARQDHSSSATTCRFSTSGCAEARLRKLTARLTVDIARRGISS